MRHWGDAHTDEAGTLNERSTADGEAKDEMLRGDERNTADGIRGDADPGTDFEEHTLAETVKDLGFQLKNRDGLVDDTAIDEPFDYDPDARQGPWGDSEHDESGDKDYIRHAREKAAIIASVIEVSSRIDQEAIFDWLTELFLEFRHPATFRAIERVASQSITPDLLRALIALRRYWMERPEWWVSRYDLRRHERPLGNGSKGLGWAVALRVCRHRAEYEAEDMIDESWFHEWLALSPGAPGYFSFAAYVNSKVTNPDSELLYEGLVRIKVRWGAETEEWVSLADVEPGFQVGWTVQDIPLSASRRSLGVGQVVGQRVLGGRHQILMQLHDEGRSLWLPYENLRRLMDVRLRFSRAIPRVADHGERFRLRLLAHALENWNHLTGSLDRLDVEPLPHQIQLVHRILSSGNYNWLIADDVGLGKTIEVGLLLAALKRKNQARRVLIIAPAGLTRQWQDELRYKFDQMYEIYGRDFTIVQPDHWKIHDHVIVSLDLAKREDHLENFQRAGAWDIVIFDEGHKLTRYASGERAQRYRLAEVLRLKTDALLLLSGTPHQGYADRFRALLELIRPDLKPQIHALELHPETVGEMILRNRKSEVTDAQGNFIFRGTQIHRVAVEPSAETRRFQSLLNDYLRRGYRVGEAGGAARAVGFVMTTYRKLASSSIAAIERALRLRLDRRSGAIVEAVKRPLDDVSLEDLSAGGDDQDDLATAASCTNSQEVFAFEKDLIEQLLTCAAVIHRSDEKLRMFLDNVVESLIAQRKKVLIFTEYRATQAYLERALTQRFPESGEVALINGSMNLDEKLANIEAFNNRAQFLISTEAGGEGINLHHSCHFMVNYDLPWNPARLVQRIGRLYRYGQLETVVVFNLHAQDSFDNYAIDLMLRRVMEIVQEMAPVGPEYNERLYAEILGEVLENVDLASVLQSATAMEIRRTREQIEEALERARTARELEQDILAHAVGFEADAMRGTLGFTMQHVDLFIRSMLPFVGASLAAARHNGKMLEIRLPEDLRGRFPEFAQRTVVNITTDRRLAQKFKEIVLLDFEAPFFRYLIERAKAHEFDGFYAAALSPAGTAGALGAFMLRWQNDQGDVLTDEFATFFASADGDVECNPSFVARWLTSSVASSHIPNVDRDSRCKAFDELLGAANRRLGAESTMFKHPNGLVCLAAADCVDTAMESASRGVRD